MSAYEMRGGNIQIENCIHKAFSTFEPENIKAVLTTQFNDFALGSRNAHFLPLLGDGIFTLESHRWKNSRAMLRPQFSREQISHVRYIEPHVQTSAAHIRNDKGEVFEIKDFFFKFTVDTVTDILFGESVNCLRDGIVPEKLPVNGFQGRESFDEDFNSTKRVLATRAYSQWFDFFINTPALRKACKTVHGFASYHVHKGVKMDDETLEKKFQSGHTFLYELVKTTKNPKVLQDLLLNIMIAGRDTTAELLSCALFELSRNSAIWQKLKEEVNAHFGHDSEEHVAAISFESLNKCGYLKYV